MKAKAPVRHPTKAMIKQLATLKKRHEEQVAFDIAHLKRIESTSRVLLKDAMRKRKKLEAHLARIKKMPAWP